ncbi:MAG: hypothetical protein GVY13_06900 [Alphaproteobacteria bacterium]|jgi:hypothetical protein|nr:hypothetical protein [Alphaproteobacteria bacterium]
MTRLWLLSFCALPALVAGLDGAAARTDYIAGIEVLPATAETPADTVRGVVFEDGNRDGIRQDGEAGVPGILVSNGREVVRTGGGGAYSLPVYDNMTVFVTEPAGYDVPLDDALVPQFFYHHLPDGTPQELRYGGLPPTGPLPAAINFPMIRGEPAEQFRCVVMGDTQPYSNTEIGYVRDSIVTDLLAQDLSNAECMILVGDVMGDDLGLLPRFLDIMSTVELPQYYIHGNHDFDFDATTDEHSADSWRHLYGPNYYAFEIGQVHFIALDNVVYPCTEEDVAADDRARCGNPEDPVYNGRVTDRQMTWLANHLALVPEDRLIVLLHHIPFVSFVDSRTGRHQTDNVNEIYALIGERPALSLSGHTHTLEQLVEGESYAGWAERVGVEAVPFNHVITGAPSGNCWSQDFNVDGIPMSFARLGVPRGYMLFDFDGNTYTDRFYGANLAADRQMWLSFNTPQFRSWYETLLAWTQAHGWEEGLVPPLSINDLADTKLFTPADLAEGVSLAANVWNGSRHTAVTVRINGGDPVSLTRTQEGEGEDVREGADYADPFAIMRQLSVARYALRSSEGAPRTQGFEIWQGERFGPAFPQAMQPWMLADQSMHLWTWTLPADLPAGTHVAEVTATDRHGRSVTDRIVFEVRAERPDPLWREDLWEEAAE